MIESFTIHLMNTPFVHADPFTVLPDPSNGKFSGGRSCNMNHSNLVPPVATPCYTSQLWFAQLWREHAFRRARFWLTNPADSRSHFQPPVLWAIALKSMQYSKMSVLLLRGLSIICSIECQTVVWPVFPSSNLASTHP